MGVAFYISIENCSTDFDVSVDGKLLAASIDKLNKYAKTKGVKPLGEFFSQDPSDLLDILSPGDREVFDKHGDKSMLPNEEWFDPLAGLTTIRALTDWVKTSPKGIKRPDDVLTDLTRFAAILAEAERRQLRWHLAVDI